MSGQTTVVKICRKDGIIYQGCTLYIGRACKRGGWNLDRSIWYNPFTIKQCESAEEACRKYEEYVRNTPNLWNHLWMLEGHTLGCWCKPGPCHGDVLIRLLEEWKESRNQCNFAF